VFDGRSFVSNMLEAGMRTTLAQRLDQTCLIKHVLIVWPLTSTLAAAALRELTGFIFSKPD